MRTVESCSRSQDWLYICLELSRDITDGIKIMLFTLPYRLESRYLTASYSIMKTRPWSCMLVVIPKCFYTWDVGLVRFLFLFFFFFNSIRKLRELIWKTNLSTIALLQTESICPWWVLWIEMKHLTAKKASSTSSGGFFFTFTSTTFDRWKTTKATWLLLFWHLQLLKPLKELVSLVAYWFWEWNS